MAGSPILNYSIDATERAQLRFYVRRRVDGEWRRGVMFIKEIVPRRAIAAAAPGSG